MDTFDFYTVKLHANTKTAIYQTLGGRTPEFKRRIVTKMVRRQGRYPIKSYEFTLACVDMVAYPDAESARKRAEEIAAGYQLADGAWTHIQYVPRD